MVENVGNLFAFIGGLGMFLYGMHTMADGLQKSAGNKMKQLPGYLTNNRLLGVLTGALITVLVQSSSATTVMVVGLVNAGALTLVQATSVIMGANIGTTITAWLVSANEWASFLKPDFIAPLILGLGAFFLLFVRDKKIKQLAEIAVGFGMLFVGIDFMSEAVEIYKTSSVFAMTFQMLGSNPLLGILAGAIVTAIIQSSSASIGILQTLAINGIVSWKSAVFITLGQNIGTCVTAILSSFSANRNAKRAAGIHLLFNLFGAIIFGILMIVLFQVYPQWGSSRITSTQISIFHTLFNIGNTIILFPFASGLIRLSCFLIRDNNSRQKREEDEIVLNHLDDRILSAPGFAVESAIKETVHMGEIVIDSVETAVSLTCEQRPKRERIEYVLKQEKVIDSMEKIITEYLVKISQLSLNEQQNTVIDNLFYTVSDIERIGDHAENLAEFALMRAENGIKFSKEALNEFQSMGEKIEEGLAAAVFARATEDMKYVRRVIKLEDEIDEMEEELREKNIKRLSAGECSAQVGVIYLDVLSNMERISDHAMNIVEYIREEKK